MEGETTIPWRREMPFGAYRAVWLPLDLEDGRIEGLTFVPNTAHTAISRICRWPGKLEGSPTPKECSALTANTCFAPAPRSTTSVCMTGTWISYAAPYGRFGLPKADGPPRVGNCGITDL
jgi:hypothetical protein